MKRYSHSTTRVEVSQELIHTLEEEEDKFLPEDKKWPVKTEVYRRKFAIIIERLKQVGKSDTRLSFCRRIIRRFILSQK